MAKVREHTNIHNSIIHNIQKGKQPKCPSSDDWINKIWNLSTKDYYFTIKCDEILIICNNTDEL